MADFAAPLQRLIEEFRRLPGIGQKSAQRLAFHVLRAPRESAAALAEALLDVKDNLGICVQCNNISDAELCPYCRDPHRDHYKICVVEEPHNILPVETTRSFDGVYHILHGSISPLRGIGPEQLRIKGLLDRIARSQAEAEEAARQAASAQGGSSQEDGSSVAVEQAAATPAPIEVILATNPTVEGEATAVYLSRLLKPLGVRVTRIAMGIPVGSDLEFADEVTMLKSLENRRDM